MICYRCIHSEIIFITVLNKDIKLLQISQLSPTDYPSCKWQGPISAFPREGFNLYSHILDIRRQLYNSPTLEEEHISQYLTEALMNESSRLSSLSIDRGFTINGGNPYDVRTSYK